MILLSSTACTGANAIKKSDVPAVKIIHTTIAKVLNENGNPPLPVEPAKTFADDDMEVVSHVGIIHLTGEHQIRWEWYTPQGDLYQTTGNHALSVPKGTYAKEGAACHTIALKDRKAAGYPGDWHVKIYLDDELAAMDYFYVKSTLKKNQVPEDITNIDFGTYHALVIGINNYKNLKKLASANSDAGKIAEILKNKYNFKVTLLLDATRSDIILAFDKIRMNLTENDNLLIYYAGHGILDNDANQGYWLPVDASNDTTLNWISNSNLTATIKAMHAKHVMVVADSCYAGKLVRDVVSPFSRGVTVKKRNYYQSIARKKSRTVMCSGGLEPVVDGGGQSGHSVFAAAFIDALINNDGILDGTQLFAQLRRPVMLNADQTPEYSDIRKAGHDGGDFLFVSHQLFEKAP